MWGAGEGKGTKRVRVRLIQCGEKGEGKVHGEGQIRRQDSGEGSKPCLER